jgi:TPP-dependent pyruvate/acetoin dehydrogenase alpha subunit
MYDPELYRSKEEVERWKARDPIPALEARLRAAGFLDDAARARIEAEVAAEIEAAIAFAESSPWEPVENLLKDVYTEARAR